MNVLLLEVEYVMHAGFVGLLVLPTYMREATIHGC